MIHSLKYFLQKKGETMIETFETESHQTRQMKMKILEDAFSQFSLTSTELEQSYSALKEEVHQLKQELKERNDENNQLREEAARNHRLSAVGEMAARMAHELRNPLGSIELFSSLISQALSDKFPQDTEKKEWTDHLSACVSAMNFAITNFLLFTRKPEPHLKAHDLKKLIRGVHPFLIHMLEQNRIQYVEESERLDGFFNTDENLLRQILMNLCLNAIDAMPQGGRLVINTITERNLQNGITITISDSGTGISEKVLPQIFDPFFTTRNKGTGLGLAIAQNAVSALQGTIQVKSIVNQGTCFIIHLPLISRLSFIKPEKKC
ncbi:MAG: ATP-binding protein [Nitrospiria bacterium]